MSHSFSSKHPGHHYSSSSQTFSSSSATSLQSQPSHFTSNKLVTGQFAHRNLIFRAEVVQQPERCRMSGFGEKDRRPIDPPPVVKLSLLDLQSGPVLPETIDTHTLLCHISLHSADRREPRGLVYNPSTFTSEPFQASSSSSSSSSSTTLLRFQDSELDLHPPVRNLLGSLTTQARLLRNEFGELGLYFVFPDLAVRTEGRWTCRFSITDIKSSEKIRGGDMPELAATFSEPFHVSPAKSFKGMLDSTPLTKAFSKQGVKLVLRNVGFSNSEDGQSA